MSKDIRNSASPTVTKLGDITIDGQPAALEFSPRHPHLFVVGTYLLEDSGDKANAGDAADSAAQSRSGSLLLFSVDDGGTLIQISCTQLEYAVTDLHFHPTRHEYFAVSGSTGCVAVYELSSSDGGAPFITLCSRHDFWRKDEIILSCAWMPANVYHEEESLLGVTTSTGDVAIARFSFGRGGGSPACFQAGQAAHVHVEAALREKSLIHHRSRFQPDCEVWTMAFYPKLSAPPAHGLDQQISAQRLISTIFSGGEDSMLRFAEIDGDRLTGPGDDDKHDSGCLLHHDSGVTAILPLGESADGDWKLVLTGSFDEKIRLIAVENVADNDRIQSKVLASLELGGGVWRLRYLESTPHHGLTDDDSWRVLIMATCMHAGCKILELIKRADEQPIFSVLGEFIEHKSMNYASGSRKMAESSHLCVSTSFYDRLLAVWQFDDIINP